MSAEDFKWLPSTSSQPMSEIMMTSAASDEQVHGGVQLIREVLDKQFKDSDAVSEGIISFYF